jgi:tRNA threonylcarbamoyladenosine biosynthesis protein TsaB
VSDGRVLAEASLNEKYVHAEKLMTQIDSVLAQSGVSLGQLDGVAISIGPGSFTGLRIGLSVAKGLAYATGKPLVAVPTLRALAQRAVDEHVAKEGEFVLAALDARRDEVYCQLFRVEGSEAKSVTEEIDKPVNHVLDEIPAGRVWITGDASDKVLAAAGRREGTSWKCVPESVAQCSAGVAGMIGEVLLSKGETADVGSLEPRYIKEFIFKQKA